MAEHYIIFVNEDNLDVIHTNCYTKDDMIRFIHGSLYKYETMITLILDKTISKEAFKMIEDLFPESLRNIEEEFNFEELNEEQQDELLEYWLNMSEENKQKIIDMLDSGSMTYKKMTREIYDKYLHPVLELAVDYVDVYEATYQAGGLGPNAESEYESDSD